MATRAVQIALPEEDRLSLLAAPCGFVLKQRSNNPQSTANWKSLLRGCYCADAQLSEGIFLKK